MRLSRAVDNDTRTIAAGLYFYLADIKHGFGFLILLMLGLLLNNGNLYCKRTPLLTKI